MKTCGHYQELISSYIDGETNDQETSELFFHLGDCAECRMFMRSVLRLQTAFRENALLVPKEAELRPSSLWKRRFAISYPIAAVLAFLMLLSGVLVFSQMTQPPTIIQKNHTEYVYLTSFPPVYIVGTRIPEMKTN
jgi:predicted anti-sigma-YlaC factor YlaD